MFLVVSQPPFSKTGGDVILCFQQLREGEFAGFQTFSRLWSRIFLEFHSHRISGRQHGRAGGGTDRCGRIKASKANAIGSELIDIWRREVFGSVTTQIPITEIVGNDQNHVGWTLYRLLFFVSKGYFGKENCYDAENSEKRSNRVHSVNIPYLFLKVKIQEN